MHQPGVPWAGGLTEAGNSDAEDAQAKGVGGMVLWYKKKPYPKAIDAPANPERCIPWWCNLKEQCAVGSSRVVAKLLPSMQKLVMPANAMVIQPSFVLFDPSKSIHVNATTILGKLSKVLVDGGPADARVFTHPVQKKLWVKLNGRWSKKYQWMCLEVDPTRVVHVQGYGGIQTSVFVNKKQGYVRVLLGQVTKVMKVTPKGVGKQPHSKQRVDNVLEMGHRLVYWAMMGPPSSSHVVMHSCEKKGCLGPHCLIEHTQQVNKQKDAGEYKRAEGRKEVKMGEVFFKELEQEFGQGV
jgi:hypothetical protein